MMKVTHKKTLQEYDEFCNSELKGKIPKWHSHKFEDRMGDCIYDYSIGEPPKLRKCVHTEESQETDLKGVNTLLSDYFYYFGDKPIQLPDSLTPIIHKNQGHKSTANHPYINDFSAWVETLKYERNHRHGEPQLKELFMTNSTSYCVKKCSEEIEDALVEDIVY